MDFRACTQDVIRNLSPPETRVAVPWLQRTAALTRKRGGYLWIQIAIQIEAFSIRDSLTKQQLVATVVSMRVVGIKVLNSRLSEYVRLAAGGESILVTKRNRVVAEIGPPRETWSPVLADTTLAEMVRQGWLTPPTLRESGPPPVPEPVMPLNKLLSDLEDDRSEK